MPESLHPHFNLKYALEGRIVTMDDDHTVIKRGRIFVSNGNIVDIRTVSGGYPSGFSSEDVIKSGGTVYPGLIELHNHLPYNILPFWVSERQFDNHTQWKRIKGYKVNVQGPMQTLGKTPGFPEAIVKYVEFKNLVGGVTTSQGVTLANSQIQKKFFHGAIRNVEETNEPDLPEVQTRIADIEDDGASDFKSRLRSDKTTLLHLAEGVDDKARSFFLNLKISSNDWAITDRLNGIHCAGLHEEDFETLARFGGTMTWSPFSNLLLYGGTANIAAAKENGILIALGSDWSPSGSKNLLEEIKVAKLVSDDQGGVFSNIELVKMITVNPARILGWDQSLGSIETGKKADFVVINGYTGDPYEKLIEASERNVYGVFINGVPRYSISRIISFFSSKFSFSNNDIELINISGTDRNYYTRESDPENFLHGTSLSDAQNLLEGGLSNILQHALDLEQATADGLVSATDNPLNLDWFILPDFHSDQPGTAQGNLEWGASVQYSQVAVPLPLDKLAVVDDDEHFSRLRDQPNLPDFLRENLPPYYGRSPLGSFQNSYIPSDQIHNSLNIAITLETFKKRSSNLSDKDKLMLLKQAHILLDQFYVHKVLKQSMYAINPVQRLERMINDLQYGLNDAYEDDGRFHFELLQIFCSLRDLHTRYYLPNPYRNRFAFLPFLIEEFYETQEDESPGFIVTKVFDTIVPKNDFKKGVEILQWNNIPIERVVELNAIAQSGSNEDARRARSIDTLTIRSLGSSLPPDENLVTLTCKDENGKIFQAEYEWMVSYYPPQFSFNPDEDFESSFAYGCDYDTLAVNNIKLGFYVTGGEKGKTRPRSKGWIYPPENHKMRGRIIPRGKGEKAGYIRIFSFVAADEKAFVNDFLSILDKLKKSNITGLVIDIRGNGGGSIPACELLLAKLSGKAFQAQSFQFLSSGLTLDLTSRQSGKQGLIDLSTWNLSLRNSKSTGELYSLGAPICRFSENDHSEPVFNKPMVLITDALCYSASDMFAAGFQDLRIGKILGIHGNTGAGGANVWGHNTLYKLWSQNMDSDPFTPLPQGANITVAVRRTLRASGYPLEDLGVRPDALHKMTKADLMNDNKDLIDQAIKEL